jgi:hypothetical protein
LSRFNKFFLDHASGRTILLFLFVAVGSFVLMAAVFTPAFQEATDGLRPLDLNFGVSAEVVYRDLPVYTDRSREIYIWFAIADYVYPATAAAFFALLWAWFFKKAPNRFFERLTGVGILAFPFFFSLVDRHEKVGFQFVILNYTVE